MPCSQITLVCSAYFFLFAGCQRYSARAGGVPASGRPADPDAASARIPRAAAWPSGPATGARFAAESDEPRRAERSTSGNQTGSGSQVGSSGQCYSFESLALSPMCRPLLANASVFLPNLLGQDDRWSIGMEMHQYHPLVKVQCSTQLTPLICHVYYPSCDASTDYPIGPCRDVCRAAKRGCYPLMKKFGFGWPDSWKCSTFPSAGGRRQCFSITN